LAGRWRKVPREEIRPQQKCGSKVTTNSASCARRSRSNDLATILSRLHGQPGPQPALATADRFLRCGKCSGTTSRNSLAECQRCLHDRDHRVACKRWLRPGSRDLVQNAHEKSATVIKGWPERVRAVRCDHRTLCPGKVFSNRWRNNIKRRRRI